MSVDTFCANKTYNRCAVNSKLPVLQISLEACNPLNSFHYSMEVEFARRGVCIYVVQPLHCQLALRRTLFRMRNLEK